MFNCSMFSQHNSLSKPKRLDHSRCVASIVHPPYPIQCLVQELIDSREPRPGGSRRGDGGGLEDLQQAKVKLILFSFVPKLFSKVEMRTSYTYDTFASQFSIGQSRKRVFRAAILFLIEDVTYNICDQK